MKDRVEDLIEQYQQAYLRANGTSVVIAYAKGWFTLPSGKWRKVEVVRAIGILNSRPSKA